MFSFLNFRGKLYKQKESATMSSSNLDSNLEEQEPKIEGSSKSSSAANLLTKAAATAARSGLRGIHLHPINLGGSGSTQNLSSNATFANIVSSTKKSSTSTISKKAGSVTNHSSMKVKGIGNGGGHALNRLAHQLSRSDFSGSSGGIPTPPCSMSSIKVRSSSSDINVPAHPPGQGASAGHKASLDTDFKFPPDSPLSIVHGDGGSSIRSCSSLISIPDGPAPALAHPRLDPLEAFITAYNDRLDDDEADFALYMTQIRIAKAEKAALVLELENTKNDLTQERRIRDLDRRTYQSAVHRLEREKNSVLKEMQIMEIRHENELITTCMTTRAASPDEDRESYDFYRAYYLDQHNLNARYQARSSGGRAVNATAIPVVVDHLSTVADPIEYDSEEEPEIFEAHQLRIVQICGRGTGKGEGSNGGDH